MKCQDFQILISASMDQALESQEEKMVERHVARCAACTEFLAQQQEMASLIQAAGEFIEPPAAIWAGIEQRIAPTPGPSRGWAERWLDLVRLPQWGMAAAAVVLLILSSVIIYDRNESSDLQQVLNRIEHSFILEARENPYLPEVDSENPYFEAGFASQGNPFRF